ncbi:Phosphoglycerate mutase [Thermobaculum terrenum ATCC BAA-798]|uniref:Phosphoglycerate mutase n=1 Tax=Thermobaculum terrenum (strain ATCC BAA-798 / CCMEE 7001 / YNP1) TaxID=525904 RepID=D1CI13_THET1|nr:histidine phosphatase family protein [Thermobaculum terrenum]ACZ43384.1 Phosphoglycerate mutase [Thermobaculum terrenum ATCC BAA-798]
MLRVWLARHGQTVWGDEDRFCGRTDLELSERGYAQAEALARRLAAEPLVAVYASPLRRALATAEAVARSQGLPVEALEGLVEMDFGRWEGRTREDVRRASPDRYLRWCEDPAAVAPEGGEGAYEVAQRALAALHHVFASHRAGAVLVVAHRTVNRILLCHYLEIPIRAYRERLGQDLCALNLLEVAGGQVRVRLLNSTDHIRYVPIAEAM